MIIFSTDSSFVSECTCGIINVVRKNCACCIICEYIWVNNIFRLYISAVIVASCIYNVCRNYFSIFSVSKYAFFEILYSFGIYCFFIIEFCTAIIWNSCNDIIFSTDYTFIRKDSCCIINIICKNCACCVICKCIGINYIFSFYSSAVI